MSTVDSRIVQMRFENEQFEKGIQSSLKSLDKLKSGLDLDKAANSLSSLDKAGKNFSLASIASGVENISSRFSTLGIIGVTALTNITNSAVNAGKRMLSALTIDPIKSGLTEYETKMNAITTILTNTKSKGTTLDDVNAALGELNTYADMTIYNFAEMTRNIGTFTAAGIDLKTSTESIKGIANLAAGSGSSAQQASTAMYQLSQALAAGSLKLQDWNSVVNAGMGGELFQNALKETAKGMGIVVDEAIPFRESLQDGWITAEVLTKTLQKFAEDDTLVKAATQVKTFTQLIDTMQESVQSGWAVSWEYIIGDREQAIEVLTSISDGFNNIVGPSADARNAMLKFWNENGGRDAIITAMSNAFTTLSNILTPIKDAFREVFPATTGQQLVDISNKIKALTENFKIGEETSAKIKTTFQGLFSVLDLGKQALTAVGSGIGTLLGHLLPATGGVLDFTSSIGGFLISVNNAAKNANIFNAAMQKVTDFLVPVIDKIGQGMVAMKNAIVGFATIDTSGVDTFVGKLNTRFSPITSLFDTIGNSFSGLKKKLEFLAPLFYGLSTTIGSAFEKIGTSIMNAFKNVDFDKIFDLVNGGLLAGIFLGLKNMIGSLSDISENAGDLVGGITGILDGVKGSLEAYQSSLKATTLTKIAVAMGILAASLVALSMIDSQKLTLSLGAMTAMFAQLFGSMAVFEKIMGSSGFRSMGKVTTAMISLSVAVLLLSTALVKVAELDFDEIVRGLTAIAGLSAILVVSAKSLSDSSGKLIKGSLGLVTFALAINVLVTAVEKLAVIDAKDLAKGLVGVGVLCAELALFMNAAQFGKMGVSTGIGLIALSGAILVLSQSVQTFAQMDAEALKQGLIGVGVVLAELALFVNLTGNAAKVTSTAIGLTILGGAMLIFSKAIGEMGSMSVETIGKGLITMAGALTILTVAVNAMPAGMIAKATGILVISAALVVLSKALDSMGGMSWEEIGKGLVTLAGSLTIITVAMTAMTGALPGAAALLVISGALVVLAGVMKTLGGMSMNEIGTSLLALVGVFAVVGGASLILAPLTPVILALSGAIVLLGIGAVAVGGGLLAFSAGLAALAVSGTAGAAAFVAVVASIVGTVPMIVKAIANGVIEFAKLIGESAPALVKAVSQVLVALLDAIDDVLPKFVEVALKLLDLVLKTLVEYVPKIVDAGVKIVIGFLQGISDNIREVVRVAVSVVINFIKGIADSIGDVIQAGVDLIISFIEGMAKAIKTNTPRLTAAMSELMDAIIDAAIYIITKSISAFVENGGKLINGLIQGIKSCVSKVITTVGDMITSTVSAISNSVSKFREIGKNVITGFINGIKDKVAYAAQCAADLAQNVVDSAKNALGIHSPSKVFKDEVGAMIAKGMASGMDKETGTAKKAASDMSSEVVEAAKEWIDERKYYNNLSLQEEYYVWETIQKKYNEGTAARIEADKQVYTLKNQMLQADYDASVKYINEKKNYNQMSLGMELEAWERVQARYAEGTEQRKEADLKVYQLKKELTEKQTALDNDYYTKYSEIMTKMTDDIEKLSSEYDNAVANRAKALFDSYSLFDAVTKSDEDVDGNTLITNLRDQIETLDEWGSNLDALSKKGVTNELIEELQAMGPKSVEQIKALNRLSTPELETYVKLWETKHAEARARATKELETLKIDTNTKIQELKVQAAAELGKYNTIWTTKTAELTAGVKKTVTSQDWTSVGTNITSGISKGITNGTSTAVNAAVNMAAKVLKATKKELGIHSPSRAFAELGKYVDQGFASGIKASSSVVENETSSLGDNALNAMRNALSMIPNLLSDDYDPGITITPVLDLSEVSSGIRSVNGMFGSNQGISVAGSITTATGRSTTIASDISSLANAIRDLMNSDSKPKVAPQITFNVNSNTGNALEISRQIQRDLTNYNRALGII